MKLIIDGREYQAVDHNSGELLHLMELQAQGEALVPGGLGMSALQRMEREGRAYAKAVRAYQEAVKGGEDVEEPLIPDAALTMMAVTIYLSRRGAGDVVSFQDSLRVGMNTVVQVADPTDTPAGDAPDPTTPGSDGPATADVATAAAPKRRTRSSASTKASPSGSRSSATDGRRSPRGTSSTSS